MPVSLWPWWCAADTVAGATLVSPIQMALEPVVVPQIAAARRIPPVWAVSGSRSPALTWWSRPPPWCIARSLPAGDASMVAGRPQPSRRNWRRLRPAGYAPGMNRTFRRLLVAGGAGFIGSNFVRLLRRTRPSTEVWVLDKLTYAGNPANLAEFEDTDGYRFFHGDICDVELVDKLAGEVDAIVNFAAETHVDRSLLDPFAFINADVLGTAVLCSAAGRHGHEVFHLVSTDEVYGDVSEGRSREDDPFRPRSPYAASKAGGEHLAWSFAASHELPLLVTRGSNTYGPYQYPEKSVPVFVTNALDDLRSGLVQTIGWYRENQRWWRPLKSDEYWDYYRRNYRPLPASP